MTNRQEVIARLGAAGALVQSLDWSSTPLGPLSAWPERVLAVLETVLESGFPLCVLLGDEPSSALVVYNEAFAAFLGHKHPSAMGSRARDVWPESWDFFEWSLRQVWRAGQPVKGKDILLRIDRGEDVEDIYATISFSPIRDDEGAVCGALLCMIETTAAVLGERRERALRALIEGLAGARTEAELFRAAGKSLSAAAKDIPFGLLYRIDEARRTASLAAVSGLAAEVPEGMREIALAPGCPFEMLQVARTGEMRLVPTAELGLSVMTALAGPPRSAAVIPVTCSAAERASVVLVVGLRPAHALDHAHGSFVQSIAREIGAALSRVSSQEEARRRAEAMAELDRAKTRFLTNVSHEFRTPLTLLIGPLEDLLEATAEPLSAFQRAALGGARRNAYRLLRYVNALLDFARVDARCTGVHFEPTDLGAFTAEIASAFEPAVARAGLRFTIDCAPLSSPVFVARDMWDQIVLNLLSNALKFTFEGEIAVSLAASEERVILTVRDTGSGIPVEALPRLFDRFYRVPGGRARTREGLGIGLALVKELVDLHGGCIRVDSALGQGSVFTVEIPRGAAHPPRERVSGPRPAAALSARAAPFVEDALGWSAVVDSAAMHGARGREAEDHAPGRILIAEDSADVRDYLVRLLGVSYEVDAAPNGAAALAIARQRPPDLVLADVIMPELDGLDLLRALRADPDTREVPVVLISARAGEDATVDALGLGADDYLVKPFSARELRARVRTHLELGRARREACESRLKDMFLGIASHELRTPLTCLKLNVQLVHREIEDIDPRLAARLAGLHRSIDRMTRLVNEMLSVAAISAGKLLLREAPCDLGEICRSAAAEQAQATRRSLTLHLPDAPVPVVADEDRTREVVANLLANACKYSAAEEPVVLALTTAGKEAIVTVRDRGPGIPREAIPHVFDRFYRVPGVGVRAGSYVGLGLGLYLSKAVIDQHHGRIWVESEVGRGSAFSFSIPLAA